MMILNMVKKRIEILLKKWKKAVYIDFKIDTKNTTLAKSYGLAKTYKNNIPLRIVVSCINWPVSQLPDYYKNLLTIACERPEHVIKNSNDFIDKVKNVTVPKHHIMASLDVVSLFPSVPYELVKKSIKKRWNNIKMHTKMPFKEFIKGLEILMGSLYFQNDNTYYKQINGLFIGLSVSRVFADILLQYLKIVFLDRYKKSIKFYGRYVDDLYIIIAKNKLSMLVKHSNKTIDR